MTRPRTVCLRHDTTLRSLTGQLLPAPFVVAVLLAGAFGCSDGAEKAAAPGEGSGGSASETDSPGLGGAGGDATDVSDDALRPTRLMPEPGESNFWLRQAIEATFAEALQEATVTEESVTVFIDEEEVPFGVELVDGGQTLRVVLDEVPEAPAELRVELSAGIAGSSGRTIEATSWSFSAPVWVDLGGPSTTPANRPDVAVDAAGAVYVAWSQEDVEEENLTHVYVSAWSDGNWQQLGDAVEENDEGGDVSIALGSDGNPRVAFTDVYIIDEELGPFSRDRQVRVGRWTGSDWELVGEPLARYDSVDVSLLADNDAYEPVLVLAADDRPQVGWNEELSGNTSANFVSWDGDAWSSVHGLLEGSSGMSSSPSMAVTSSARTVVGFEQRTEGEYPRPYVQYLEGGTWSSYGSHPGGDATRGQGISVDCDSEGQPWVVYTRREDTNWPRVVERWNGSSWEAVGEPLDLHEDDDSVSYGRLIVGADDLPVVSWVEAGNVYVQRWDGESWEHVGPPIDAVGLVRFALDPWGAPVIGDLSMDGSVQVRRLNR